jgi:aminomuconate-semialdehyde/2-hydroxymuconate-6-semialdehyde dehydrogenase
MDAGALNYTSRRPVGVAGLISPWNLPLYLLSWKIAPAIATGNTVVCKPSEMTSLTAFLFGSILNEAGMPAGVVNIVFGKGPTAGQALVEHPDVPLISFTGGTATGEKLAAAAAPRLKRLSLELGGKNPNIVFDDADVDDAVATSVRASFLNQGEICLCGSRLFVQEKIYEPFMERFITQVAQLKVGDPRAKDTFIGPVVSSQHRDKIRTYIEQARSEGARFSVGDRQPPLGGDLAQGYFVHPVIVEGLDHLSRICQEEIFGPFVSVTPFSTEEDVILKANSVKYGLSASIFTRDVGRAHRVAEALDVGTVWVNTWMMRDLRVPFGGVKASGLGREGGAHSIDFYTDVKNICLKY